jgi:uncharacterized protein YdhG (YjbR/CyaY superfamily)
LAVVRGSVDDLHVPPLFLELFEGGSVEKKPGYSSIDDYINSFPENVQERLTQIRLLIRKIAPGAQEKISYQMPAFYLNGNLVYFAAHSRHIGLYPTPSGSTKFKHELSRYKQGKGSIQFPLEEPLPVELIKKIVKYRVEQNSRKLEK